MKAVTKFTIAAGVFAGVSALLFGPGRRIAAARIRAVSDPAVDPILELPDDVVRHDIPTRDGGSVHVVEAGQGRPLVLIHGVTLAAEVWAPVMHLTRDRFRVLALDVRGHGRSVVGSDGVGRRFAAEDLATVLEALDITDAIVCGHSMGGMILGQFCGDFPEVLDTRVAGLAFMNTAVHDLIPPVAVGVAERLGEYLLKRSDSGRPLGPPTDPDNGILFMRMAFGARPSGAAVEVARQLGNDLSEDHRTLLWVDLFDTDNREALRNVVAPSVVMVGSRDLLTPVYAAKRFVECLSDTTLEVVPGAGHQLMQERPAEVAGFFDDLVSRIESHDPARA